MDIKQIEVNAHLNTEEAVFVNMGGLPILTDGSGNEVDAFLFTDNNTLCLNSSGTISTLLPLAPSTSASLYDKTWTPAVSFSSLGTSIADNNIVWVGQGSFTDSYISIPPTARLHGNSRLTSIILHGVTFS